MTGSRSPCCTASLATSPDRPSSSSTAIAVGEIAGPDVAFEILDALDLDDYRYFHSTPAAVLRRLGRGDEARLAYERALELTAAGPEQRLLAMRLAELLPPTGRD